MNRITNYSELEERIVSWLKDYAQQFNIKAFVIGVSGGIDSAVSSTLAAKTGLPTYPMLTLSGWSQTLIMFLSINLI